MAELFAIVVKTLGYAAALTGAGSVIARTTLRPDAQALPALETLVRWAGVALALCAACAALLFMVRLGGVADPAILEAVFLSPLGAALALQLAGGAWLLVSARKPAALVGAAMVLASFAVAGHSATHGPLAMATVALHVSAAAWWVGGLWLLLLAQRRLHGQQFAALASRFSQQAAWMVVVLVCGALATAASLLQFRFVPDTAYVRGLLGKAVLTVLLLGVAGFNRFVLVPGIEAKGRSMRWFRRAMQAELLLLLAVLCGTAWLTTTQSPR